MYLKAQRDTKQNPHLIINLISLFTTLISLSLLFSYNNQYTLIVSFDGFRYDYLDMAETPNFDNFLQDGVSAESLIPVFPSLTFPNHYSIATGSYVDSHRILSNSFYSKHLDKTYSMRNSEAVQNGNFYGMEPIWVTAEKHNLNTATYFWIGSEAEISGHRPSIYKNYDGSVSFESRIDSIITWFNYDQDKRPKLSMLYFSEPDYTGHRYGTKGTEIISAIIEMDKLFGSLLEKLKTLDIYKELNIIVVSDHGMTEVDRKRVLLLDQYINLDLYDLVLGPTISSLNFKSTYNYEEIDSIRHLSIYNSSSIPDRYHFKNSDMPDYLLVADEGWFISTSLEMKSKIDFPSGMHGYDNTSMNMHGFFMASGPSFNNGIQVESFESINIYPIICRTLNISPYDVGNSSNWDYSVINRLLKE